MRWGHDYVFYDSDPSSASDSEDSEDDAPPLEPPGLADLSVFDSASTVVDNDPRIDDPAMELLERQAAFVSLDATALEVRYNPATEDSDAVRTVIDIILARARTGAEQLATSRRRRSAASTKFALATQALRMAP